MKPSATRAWSPRSVAIAGLTIGVVLCAALSHAAGGDGAPVDSADDAGATLITVAGVERRDVEVWLESMGKAKSRTAPTVAAEVDGRVEVIHVETGDTVEQNCLLLELDTSALELERAAVYANIHRIEAQIANERRRVARFRKLSDKEYVARTQLDDSEAQLAVYRADLEAEEARLAIAEDRIDRARVPAHVGGVVERRYVSEGDFVKRGDPLFDITQPNVLRVWLPLPEPVAGRLSIGQRVTLWSPLAMDLRIEGTLDDLRPTVGAGSRAVTAIVDVTNPGPWRAEATVVGRILVERHEQALLVPAMALVRRPAGETLYVVDDGRVDARVVKSGERVDDRIEIVQGLDGSETVVVEGASWLTDGARVRVAGDQP